MTALALVLSTALLLGALHAFDVDHLAAVTSFIARRPSPRAAFGFAIRWGLGHATTLLTVGLASVLFRFAIAPSIETAAELAVGVMLVGVGLWVLTGLRRGRLLIERHIHDGHAHTHLHRPEHPHHEPAHHSIFWVGALHGLAGSAALLVLIPVAMLSSVWTVIAYIVMFNVGVSAAMGLYAFVLGGLLGRIAHSDASRWYPWLAGAAGSMTVVLGLTWIGSTLA